MIRSERRFITPDNPCPAAHAEFGVQREVRIASAQAGKAGCSVPAKVKAPLPQGL